MLAQLMIVYSSIIITKELLLLASNKCRCAIFNFKIFVIKRCSKFKCVSDVVSNTYPLDEKGNLADEMQSSHLSSL